MENKKFIFIELYDFITARDYLNAALYIKECGLSINDINARHFDDGTKFIHKVVANGKLDELESFLIFGLNPNVLSNGRTPIMQMVRGYFDIERFELLIKYGADVNHQNERGTTAMMEAVLCNNFSGMVALFTHGADVHIRDGNGRTAKEIAVLDGKYSLADSITQWMEEPEHEEDFDMELSQ